jgi:hypothetical protein
LNEENTISQIVERLKSAIFNNKIEKNMKAVINIADILGERKIQNEEKFPSLQNNQV